jgi:hypothetical protein
VELYIHYPNTPSWRSAQLSTGTTLLYFTLLYFILTNIRIGLLGQCIYIFPTQGVVYELRTASFNKFRLITEEI